MLLKKFAVVLMTASLAFNAACSSCKKNAVESGKAEQVFTFGNMSEPEFMDPALAQGQPDINILINLFEGLTEYDPKTAEPVPGLASRWDISPDGKTYTFYLRPEAKWSDGNSVSAEDFVYSWRRAVDPNTASRYASILYYVKNAEAINTGKIADLTQLGVQAKDAHTLVVELDHATPYFPALTAFVTYRPVKKEIVEKFDRKWTRAENMVGNGPFMLKEWTPSKQIVMVKNPHYWDANNVKLDKIIALPIEDQETALKKFLSDEVQFLYEVSPNKIPSLRSNPEFSQEPIYSTYYVSLNVKKKPFDDQRVRQALSYAVDRSKITQVINKGFPSGSFTPTGAGYTAIEGHTFDPDKARQLFAAAGYVNPADFPSVTYVYNTNEVHKAVAEMLQNMWRENLGINVSLQNMEFKVLLSARHTGDYEMSRDGWNGDYMDPSTFMELHLSNGTNNHTFWGNAEFDRLVKEAGATLNKQQRFELYTQAEKILLDEAPVIPLYFYTRELMISKKVSGLYGNAIDQHPLKFVSIVPEAAAAQK